MIGAFVFPLVISFLFCIEVFFSYFPLAMQKEKGQEAYSVSDNGVLILKRVITSGFGRWHREWMLVTQSWRLD